MADSIVRANSWRLRAKRMGDSISDAAKRVRAAEDRFKIFLQGIQMEDSVQAQQPVWRKVPTKEIHQMFDPSNGKIIASITKDSNTDSWDPIVRDEYLGQYITLDFAKEAVQGFLDNDKNKRTP